MSPHDKTDADGAQSDGVPYKSATDKLPIYAEVRQQLASFQEPVLLHADNPHERLFVALRLLYEGKSAGHPIVSAQEDKALFERYATAYAAAQGPQRAVVDQWKRFMAR